MEKIAKNAHPFHPFFKKNAIPTKNVGIGGFERCAGFIGVAD